MGILKEQYFSPASIHQTARCMLASLETATRIRPVPALDQSALLVLDMQQYFLNEQSHAFIPSAPAILPIINAMILAYARLNLPILFTRHINTAQDAGSMGSWWRDLLTEEMELSQLDPRVLHKEGILFTKNRYDAFLNSPLEHLLKKQKIKQLVICGVMTHLCCETTARSAFMRDYEVFFTIDGTATYHQAFHQAALLNLAHGFATPVLAETICSMLEQHSG